MIISRNISSRTQDERGFTLVELMIALLVSGLVMAAVITVYVTQTRSFSELDDVAGIQQDLRGVLILLNLEVRLAGCDPTEGGKPGILDATSTQFHFTHDTKTKDSSSPTPNKADGEIDGADENITFGLAAGNDTNDNGIVDNGGADWSGPGLLARNTGGGLQPLADNIEALEFNYILDDGTSRLDPPNPNKIRAVQVSLLARATKPDRGFVNTKTYTTASGVTWNPPDDNFRRRLVVTNIQLRNMGF